jgi:hypothetical protein
LEKSNKCSSTIVGSLLNKEGIKSRLLIRRVVVKNSLMIQTVCIEKEGKKGKTGIKRRTKG